MEEKQALLYKEEKNFRKNLSKNRIDNHGSSSEESEEWWDDSNSSCSSCRESPSESSYEWESEVNEKGHLFYIESDINICEESGSYKYQKNDAEDEQNTEKSRNVKGGRLVNWMRRRDIKKLNTKQRENIQQESSTQINYIKEGNNLEFKEISVKIESIFEGSSVSEKLLGLMLSGIGNVVKITSVNPNGPTSESLVADDILLKINDYNVTPQNLDGVLGTITIPSEVILKVQKNDSKPAKYQSNFVKSLQNKNEALDKVLIEKPIGIVVVDMESQNLNKDDVIYSYPDKCALSSCRGAFVTLFHLLAQINPNDQCQSSSVIIKKQPTHILYKSEKNLLLLIAIPKHKCSIQEANYIIDDLIRNLLFNYQTLKGCFEKNNKTELDHFFSLFFSRVLTNGFSANANNFVNPEDVMFLSEEVGSSEFEDILPHAIWVPLPKEAQIQIDDALNELEANDIDHEDPDILDSQRLFNVIGSCLFYKGYLLMSHLPKDDLLDVYCFYRQNSLIQLFSNEPVKSLVVWKEIYPQSVYRGLPVVNPSKYPAPKGRWFLLIVGQGFNSLAVILEAGVYCAELNEITDPAVAYIEEARDTLQHMQKLGIFSLASQWIENNCRFKTITPEDVLGRKGVKKKDNLLGFVKFDGNPKPPGFNVPTGNLKTSETTPKKSRGFQKDTSEDSASQTTSNVSEVSDENAPILGRRAERGRAYTDHGSDSDSSSSDWDSSRDSNMRESTCSSGIENFYLGDMGEVIPAKLTTGPDNLLFSYINIDGNEGVLINAPLNSKKSTPKMIELMENFRKCTRIIHTSLENLQKNGQNSSKGFFNKSQVAVKEHGVLYECTALESDSHRKSVSFTYWIVGRLFFTPQPREVYVCYYNNAPQNLIEIAFRLGLSAAG